MRCTSSTGKPEAPQSPASLSCSTNSCRETSLVGAPRHDVGRPARPVDSTWKTGCCTCARAVSGTREKPPWSSSEAATSRSPASPTRTVGLRPGSPSARPTNPLGLFGARGSSSDGLATAADSPAGPLNTYEPPRPWLRASGQWPAWRPCRTVRRRRCACARARGPPITSTTGAAGEASDAEEDPADSSPPEEEEA